MSQYAVTNPATGEVVETFDGATDQQIPVSYTHLTLPTIYSV